MMSQYPTMKITDEQVNAIRQRATAAIVLSESASATANQGADLSQWCGTVFNQQSEGSCTACTTRDYLLWLQNKYGYNPIVDPSVNALYYYGRKIFGDLNQDGGSTIQDAFQATITYGVIPSPDETYSRDTLFIEPPSQDVVFKATNEQNLAPNTASIRASLDNGVPAGIAIMVDKSLFSPVVTTDGIVGFVDVSDQVPNEAHALFVMRYMPHPKYGFLYRAQGSWGTGYGDNGYIWLTEAYMQKNLFEVGTLDIPKSLNPPAPKPQPKSDYSLEVSLTPSQARFGQSISLNIRTLKSGQPFTNFSTATATIERPNGTFTPTYNLFNGFAFTSFLSQQAGKLNVTITWHAPDGTLQTSSAESEWVTSNPQPNPIPVPPTPPKPQPVPPTPPTPPQPSVKYTIEIEDQQTADKFAQFARSQGWNISLIKK